MPRSGRVLGKEVVGAIAQGDRIREGKIQGIALGDVSGLTVYYNIHKPKTEAGKRRVTISIRQLNSKTYRHYAALIYPYGADISFEGK